MHAGIVTLLKVALAASVLTFSVAGCSPTPPPASAPEAVVPAPPALDPLTTQRISDLVAINAAVQAFYNANGQYPVTPNRGSFVSVVSAGNDWIPGLAPTFMPALPSDPAGSTDQNNQYWYASQGGSYKLIVHGVGAACGPEVEESGILRDPARSEADGTCWAYGFWTADMANY
jgi:hypothetical protein